MLGQSYPKEEFDFSRELEKLLERYAPPGQPVLKYQLRLKFGPDDDPFLETITGCRNETDQEADMETEWEGWPITPASPN